MAHKCPDGTHSKLVRTGPIGTVEGVTYDCPRCGYHNDAATMLENARRILNDPAIRAALR